MAADSPKLTQRYCAEERRRQILEVATQLFAGQGFGSTTTRHIAELAQVNEALIFRHFPTKDDLYWAVLEHKCEQGYGRRIVEEHLARHAPVGETLSGIARSFFELRRQDSTLGGCCCSSGLERHALSHRFFRTHISDLYESLAQYIRERIAAEELKWTRCWRPGIFGEWWSTTFLCRKY